MAFRRSRAGGTPRDGAVSLAERLLHASDPYELLQPAQRGVTVVYAPAHRPSDVVGALGVTSLDRAGAVLLVLAIAALALFMEVTYPAADEAPTGAASHGGVATEAVDHLPGHQPQLVSEEGSS